MNTQPREVIEIIKPQTVMEGAGVRLKRSMATAILDHLDPFLLFDHFGSDNPADYVKGSWREGALTLDHVTRYHAELASEGIDTVRVAPMLLPDYSNPEVRDRQLTTNYVGTVR